MDMILEIFFFFAMYEVGWGFGHLCCTFYSDYTALNHTIVIKSHSKNFSKLS